MSEITNHKSGWSKIKFKELVSTPKAFENHFIRLNYMKLLIFDDI